MSTFTNSEDQDEMQHNDAFHQGLQCFVKVKKIFRQKITILFKNYNINTPRFVQLTILSLLYQARRNNPLVYKGLIDKILCSMLENLKINYVPGLSLLVSHLRKIEFTSIKQRKCLLTTGCH